MYRGSCLCGAVKYVLDGPLVGADACHCAQCRKWTGHYLASVDVKRAALTIESPDCVTWFHSSDRVRRGFCGTCGSSLFFDPLDRLKHDWIAVALGSFDVPTQTRLAKHIFVAEKGDYYSIQDGLPQHEH